MTQRNPFIPVLVFNGLIRARLAAPPDAIMDADPEEPIYTSPGF